MKKVLLVGSSFSALPILFLLKEKGFHVSVCGILKNDPCHYYSDESYFLDYSIKENLLKLASDIKFDFIVPTCNDYSYLSSSWVANQLGFPGFDSNEITNVIHNKLLFREETKSINLPSPQLFNESSIFEDFFNSHGSFELLIKPVDSFSGKGVSKIDNQKDLENAIREAKYHSRTGSTLIEEFVNGSLHSHSAFITSNQISLDFFVDEYCTVYPYQVNCSNHPSKLNEIIKNKVRDSINKLIQKFNLTDGLLHTQFIVKNENVWIIECMRRCPGDLFGYLIEKSTGVNYTNLYVASFINENSSNFKSNESNQFYGRHTISSINNLINFSFRHNIPCNEMEIIQLKTSGEKLKQAPYDKLGIVFAKFGDFESMNNITPNLADYINIIKLNH